MSAVRDVMRALSLQRSPYWSRQRLMGAQSQRLCALIHHAYATVPFYREHFDRAGIRPEDIRSADDLGNLPIVTRADLQSAGAAIRSNAFSPSSLRVHRSTGSTGRPVRIWTEAGFRRVREALFFRALRAAGYRPGDVLLLLPHESQRSARPVLRWHYASILDSPEAHLETYARVRPRVLYGCTTPLRRLADEIRARDVRTERTHAVITVAESLDAQTRRRLGEAFGAEVFDFYGMTEAGMIGFECSAHAGYHMAEDTSITELHPSIAGDSHHLVLTNMMLWATPLLRFETGDLAVPGASDRCECGRTLTRIERIAGRSADCIQLAGGTVLSPYHVTCALERVRGIDRFRVVQESPTDLTVHVEGRCDDEIDASIRRAMHGLVGESASVRVVAGSRLEPAPGTKFRVVESRLSGARLSEA